MMRPAGGNPGRPLASSCGYNSLTAARIISSFTSI